MSVLSVARRVSDCVNHAAVVVCILCVLAMLAISFIGFLYTVFTGGALSWTYSLARIFLPWIGLISTTIALYWGEHVAMTLFVRLLPEPLVKVAAIICLVVIAIFALMMIWYGWQFFINARQTYMVSHMIQIPQYFTAIAVPLTGIVTLIHLVRGFDLLEHFVTVEDVTQQAIREQQAEDV
ncbi:TRAP transporter small permease [Fodinicurvata sediminis]|uniref:TRAP transporter small permease n=1 Tax=Fodinicurvata sediminis TaxID=1121832 RepID=UPI0003B77B33|nr:TRAP transporter small permease subunit [Fodinicurvata sediminis]